MVDILFPAWRRNCSASPPASEPASKPDPPTYRLSFGFKGTRRSNCSSSRNDTSSPSPTTMDYVARRRIADLNAPDVAAPFQDSRIERPVIK
ncbi:hypothetical protein CORC01_12536 [Colletotrichum orchidophilum]|uniref:Uncharacterized protein n=1 Tax=Colletotrichum orchidophilum TaxID=1209926 RepID=A0A1G4ASW0_9PEZI|nr:uncharacterized protein CORC01_12536 [Colletotrichum orchidophilum]OHE92191.1 hypothetical protein CORC01_12536 [Colletotrichum orchidophilum]